MFPVTWLLNFTLCLAKIGEGGEGLHVFKVSCVLLRRILVLDLTFSFSISSLRLLMALLLLKSPWIVVNFDENVKFEMSSSGLCTDFVVSSCLELCLLLDLSYRITLERIAYSFVLEMDSEIVFISVTSIKHQTSIPYS